MTTDSQGISARVSNSRDFGKLIAKHQAEWPSDLTDRANRALLSLQMIEGNPPHVMDAMKENAPSAWAGVVRDLMDFAEAYGAWKARP